MIRQENKMNSLGLCAQKIKNALCALLMLIAAQVVMAFEYQGINYTINSRSQTATATGMASGAMPTTLIIPDYAYDGTKAYPVTAISASAFYNSKDVHRVVIGDNVTTIGANAFYQFGENGNDLLLVLGKNVTSIGSDAFYSFVWFGTREGQTTPLIVKGDDPSKIKLHQTYAPIGVVVYVKDADTYAKFKSDSYWKQLDNVSRNHYEYPIPVEVNVKGGQWQTALLPETMTQGEVESYFGKDTKVARLSEDKYQWESPTAPYVVRFDLQQQVEASVPVLIKPTHDYWYVATAAYKDNPRVTMTDNENQIRVNMIGAVDDYNLDFGQIYLRNQSGTMQFFSADNAQSDPQAKSDVWVKRGKCYFEMRDFNDRLLYDIPVGYDVQQSTTAIRDVNRIDRSPRQGVYSLTGQYEGTTLEGLAPGIHIVNGRKVVVK